VRVDGVEVVVAELELRRPVRSAGLVHSDKTTVFLRVVTDRGSGWGECAASADARDPDPTLDEVEPLLVDRVLRRFLARGGSGTLPAPSTLARDLLEGASAGERAVVAALEMAVFDVVLRAEGFSLAAALGAVRREVESGALVGIPDERETGPLLAAAEAAVGAGARRLRVKIEPGWDHRPLGALRAALPEAVLLADANGAFAPAAAPGLRSLDDYGLACLEQPFGPHDLAAHRALGDAMDTPIGLDESLWSTARVHEALAAEACRVACLKPGRLGGIAATLEAAEACARAGVACFVGGFFESGLARAVNAAVAGTAPFVLPGDLGDPDGYLSANPFSYLPVEAGMVALSDAPGLGAEVRPEVLRSETRQTRWLPRAG